MEWMGSAAGELAIGHAQVPAVYGNKEIAERRKGRVCRYDIGGRKLVPAQHLVQRRTLEARAAHRMHKIVKVGEITTQDRARRGNRMTGNDGARVNSLREARECREVVHRPALDEKGESALA